MPNFPHRDQGSGLDDPPVGGHRLLKITKRVAACATASALGALGLVGLTSQSAFAAPATPYQNNSPYYEVSPSGAVWNLGGAPSYGSPKNLTGSIVGTTLVPGNKGYWLLGSNGAVYQFGSARWHGAPSKSIPSMHHPVGIVSTPDGAGYWVYGANGMIGAFGDAHYYGGTKKGVSLAHTVVSMVSTPDGKGYWTVDSVGDVRAYGDAHNYGTLLSKKLPSPIVSMAATADGKGYWLLTAAGGVYAKGDARWEGSVPSAGRNQVMQKIVGSGDNGYWVLAHDGDLHTFGSSSSAAVPEVAFVHKILNRGDRALEWAMKQLGKPYEWGGTGPNSFDCSGLTMMSWKAAGVAIPRVADDQYHSEPAVSIPRLVDGDLVFWATNPHNWQTVYHVAMYIGGGHIVQAPHTGTDVSTAWIGGDQFVTNGTNP